jgi:hypothetical protein
MGKDLERDVFKILALGLFGIVLIKAFNNSGGVAQIIKAIGGTYTDTLGTLAKA